VPKYTYKCKECELAFDTFHGMFMKLKNCDVCDTNGTLYRVPSVSYSTGPDTSYEKKAGETVKEFISDTKKEVEKQKEDMREEYKK
jgi:hypothetical protein|tara:strand:+ start:551 stop:808 length:258 start_codon:yes stop_codon:yes gene_type:complete